MVESGVVGTFRRDAAARSRDEPGRHWSWGGGAVAARNARRLRPAATCAADGTPHLGQRSREHDGLATASSGFLRRRRFTARAESFGRDYRAEADRRLA